MFACEYCNKSFSIKDNLKRHGDCRKKNKTMITSEINLKRKLIEDTNAVRKKYKTHKLQSSENRLETEEFYKSVTIQLMSHSAVDKSVSKHKPDTVEVDTAAFKESYILSSKETNKEEDYNDSDDNVYNEEEEEEQENKEEEEEEEDEYENEDEDEDKDDTYIYWNTPKELVERLRFLWALKQTEYIDDTQDNEIIFITEELRELKIIY
jgi:hypothetical protein